MTANITPVASADYYTKYLGKGDGQVESPGQAVGAGMRALGITGTITDRQAEMLCNGFHPKTGEALVQNAGKENHRAGLDITFSAPKSVSVLWAFAEPEMKTDIKNAHAQAVKKALSIIERDYIQSRTGKAGHGEAIKGAMAAITFDHTTSRQHASLDGESLAPDMQLHTHSLILNLAFGADNTWRSLDSDQFFQRGMPHMLGAMYRAELAKNMHDLGFKIEQKPKDMFDILGIDKQLLRTYSKRRNGIEELIKRLGITNPKTIEKLVMTTKMTKNHALDIDELHDSWLGQLEALGITPGDVIDGALCAKQEAQVAVIARDALLDELTKNQSTFREHDIKKSAYVVAQNLALGADQAHEIAAELMRDNEILSVGKGVFTTRKMLILEAETLRWAESAARQDNHKFDGVMVEAAIIKNGLSDEQANAMRKLAAGSGIGILSGMAGTGKSRTMFAYREACEASGFHVHGIALAGRAALGLEEGSGITSSTIHRLLIDIENGNKVLTKQDVIVLDEAGMADTKLVARVTQACEISGAKLVLLGDAKQLQSVGAGGIFDLLKDKIGDVSLTEIWRQNSAADVESVHSFADGDAQAALDFYDENRRLHLVDTINEAMESAVTDFLASPGPMASKILIAGRRADVDTLNAIAREKLSDSFGPSIYYSTESGPLEIAEGERIVFKKNDKNLGLMNGETGTVKYVGIDELTGKSRLVITKDSGEEVAIIDSDYDRIDYAYAGTAHGAQGATKTAAFVYQAKFSSRELAYVALSRHTDSAHIYAAREEIGATNTKAELARIMSVSSQKQTAIAYIEGSGISILDVIEGRNSVEELGAQLADQAEVSTGMKM